MRKLGTKFCAQTLLLVSARIFLTFKKNICLSLQTTLSLWKKAWYKQTNKQANKIQSCWGPARDIIIYQNILHNTPEILLFESILNNPEQILSFMVFFAFFMPLK